MKSITLRPDGTMRRFAPGVNKELFSMVEDALQSRDIEYNRGITYEHGAVGTPEEHARWTLRSGESFAVGVYASHDDRRSVSEIALHGKVPDCVIDALATNTRYVPDDRHTDYTLK